MKTILLIWIICGIFAVLSCYVTSYIMTLSKGSRMAFVEHCVAVTFFIQENYGRHGWLKMFLASIALGPIGLIAHNVIIYRVFNGDDKAK